jgi:hypothetical protein
MRSCLILLASVALTGVACSPDTIPADGVTTTSNDSTTGEGSSESSEPGDPSDTDTSGNDTDVSTNTSPVHDTSLDHPCAPFAQDCPEGEKCVPYGSTGGNWDANKCVPILGDKQPGESCSYAGVIEATDDCDASSHCWDVMDVDGEQMGICTRFCEGTPENPQCPEQTSCLISNNGSITLCIKTCDPIAQDCGPGLECVEFNGHFNCIFTGGGSWIGEPCDQMADCPPGGICMNASVFPECAGSACCAQICSLADPSCTLEGTACVAYFDDPPPGGEDLGVCIVE